MDSNKPLIETFEYHVLSVNDGAMFSSTHVDYMTVKDLIECLPQEDREYILIRCPSFPSLVANSIPKYSILVRSGHEPEAFKRLRFMQTLINGTNHFYSQTVRICTRKDLRLNIKMAATDCYYLYDEFMEKIKELENPGTPTN